jgi:histidine triad (HIT) family protein
MSYDANNIFAKILHGELPCMKIYEDAQSLAFLDIMPSTPGHTLVIPKEAAETLFDLSPAGGAALMAATQKVAGAVRRAMGCDGVMLVQLNGVAAGQSVPHVHFHVLPRTQGLDLQLHGRGMVDQEMLEPVAARIRSAL